MAYPGETARRTRTTAEGVEYLELTVDPYASGDTALVLVPAEILEGDPVVLLLVAHGHGGTQDTVNGPGFSPLRDAALARGWVVASSYAHGNAWANDAALADYRRVWDWVADTWPVADTLLHGASMGGLTMANLYHRDAIPNTRALVTVDAVYNLGAVWTRSANYRETMRGAYGIAADGSDFTTKTAAHDPVLLDRRAWAGKRLLVTSSWADTAILKGPNTDAFVDHVRGYPAELVEVEVYGSHVVPENYAPDRSMTFLDAALNTPEWPTPPLFPDGLTEVELWTVQDGLALQLHAWAN